MWGRRRHGLTNHFTLAVYMQFLVAADTFHGIFLRISCLNSSENVRAIDV